MQTEGKDRTSVSDKRDKNSRIHPFTIAVFLYRNAFLLIIPILQYLIFKPQGFWNMVRQGSSNVIAAVLIVLYIVLKYRNTYVFVGSKKIVESKGIFFKRKRIIFEKRLCGAAMKRGAVSSLFGAAVFYVDSGGRHMAVEEYVSKSHKAVSLWSGDGRVKRLSFFESFVAAADATSALSGLLLIIPFLRKTAPVVGGGLSESFYGSVDLWSQLVSQLLPPAVAYVSGFIAAGYIFAFSYELLKHINTRITQSEGALEICRGFIWRLNLLHNAEEISAITHEQGMICRIFGIKKVFVLSGLGKKLGSERELVAVFRGRLKKPDSSACITPKSGSIFSFMLLPLVLFLLNVLFAFYLQFIGKPVAVSVIMSTAVPFFLFWTMFRAAAFEHTFLYGEGDRLIAGTYSGFRFMQAEIETTKINFVVIKQSPLQKLFGSCTVQIFVRNRKKPFVVRTLRYSGEFQLCI